MDLDGAIDLHVHCGPDTRPRKMTAFELVRTARDAGMGGLLLKNHDAPTTILAAAVREVEPEFPVFGGIVLNDALGGLNPAAVESALRFGARQVWMPTHCSRQERRFRGRPGGIALEGSENGFQEICALIAKPDCILGTGHLSPAEIRPAVQIARGAGVRKILITHPEIAFVDLSLSDQLALSGNDVWFERCYVREGFETDWDRLAASIRATGVARNVLATDLGQPANPDPVTGLAEMRDQLAARGFRSSELRTLMRDNPAHLLGL